MGGKCIVTLPSRLSNLHATSAFFVLSASVVHWMDWWSRIIKNEVLCNRYFCSFILRIDREACTKKLSTNRRTFCQEIPPTPPVRASERSARSAKLEMLALYE